MLMCIPEKFQNNKTNGSHLSHYSNRAGASVNIHFVNVLKLNAMYSDFGIFMAKRNELILSDWIFKNVSKKGYRTFDLL